MSPLANQSFEEGHHHQGGISELVVPDDWYLYYLDNETFPGIGDGLEAYRPESVVWYIDHAPAHERDVLFLDGQYCWKIFKAWAPCYFAAVQTVRALTTGHSYRLTARVYPDIVDHYDGATKVRPDDPWAAEVRVGWSTEGIHWPAGGDGDVNWSPWCNAAGGTLTIGQYNDVILEFTAPGPTLDLWVECKAKWGLENNWFFDDFLLEETAAGDGTGTPDAKPPGYRRIPYARTSILLPPDGSLELSLAATQAAWLDRRTVLYSADDAAEGVDLESRTVIAVNPEEWEDDLQAFYEEHYPGAIYVPIHVDHPDDLPAAIAALDDDDQPPPPTPEPPEPEPPPPTARTTRGHWGLHVQLGVQGVDRFVREMRPPVMKSFTFEDAPHYVNLCYDTQVFIRQYVGNDYGQFLEIDDLQAGARCFIDTFRDSAHARVAEIQALHPDRPLPCFRVESLNEIYPSFNREIVRRAAQFDVAFVEEMHAEFGPYVGAAVYTAGVGNPHESEYDELERVAEACLRYNGVMSLHDYWWIQDGLVGGWPWHAGRWAGVDAHLASKGLAPLWYSGEAGAIYSAVDGWRDGRVYDGDWGRAMEDVMTFDQLVADWNRDHDNRFLGACWFTTGFTSNTWKSFLIGESEFLAIEAAMKERYP